MLNPNFRRRLHTIMLAFIGFCKAKRTRREWQAREREWLLFLALFLSTLEHRARKNNTNQSLAQTKTASTSRRSFYIHRSLQIINIYIMHQRSKVRRTEFLFARHRSRAIKSDYSSVMIKLNFGAASNRKQQTVLSLTGSASTAHWLLLRCKSGAMIVHVGGKSPPKTGESIKIERCKVAGERVGNPPDAPAAPAA
jgi:hypothetical protein